MKARTEHRDGVKLALGEYQAALNRGDVVLSPFDSKKGKVLKTNRKKRQSDQVEVFYADLLKAQGIEIPIEVNPAHAKAGTIGHRILAREITAEMLFPTNESDEDRARRISGDKELAELDSNPRTQWMFSDSHPTADGVGKKIVKIIKFFFGLGRKNPILEKKVIIPAGKYRGKHIFLVTRADSIDHDGAGGTAVDNLKLGSRQSYSSRRVQMDMAMQELTAAAVIHGEEIEKPIWRKGEPVTERVIMSRRSLMDLPFRESPTGRLVCSDGVLGDGVVYRDGGRSAKRALTFYLQKAVDEKARGKKRR